MRSPGLRDASAADLPRKLGLLDSICLVVGIVIGGGIFLVPNLVARNLPSAPMIVAVWIFAGVVSFFGALASAELGAAFPATGGQYIFLRDAYGPLAGFLCGWSNFTVARSAQIAWLAVVFSLFVGYFHPLAPAAARVLSLGVIALLTWINYRGVEAGALVQRCFTLAKVAGTLIIIGSAFLLAEPAPPSPPAGHPTVSGFGVALIACLLAYDGWVQLTFVSGEIRNPNRNVLRALATGTLVCIAIYLAANFAYLRVLTIPQIAASEHVGASAAERALGVAGGSIVSAIILVSILGTLNGSLLTSPRVYFAQASDRLFFRRFGSVHPRYGTPAFAIVMQSLWAAVLVLSGSYESLLDYALFCIWVLYGLMIGAVIVLRRKRPEVERPYRMWGYPFTAILFLAITAWFLANMLMKRPAPSLAGLGLMASGVPVYFMWRRRAVTFSAELAAVSDSRV